MNSISIPLQKTGLATMNNKFVILNTQLYPLQHIQRAADVYSAIATLKTTILDESHVMVIFEYENEKLSLIDCEFCNYLLSLIATSRSSTCL